MNTRTVTAIPSTPKNRLFPARTIRTLLADDSPLLMALLVRIVSKDERVLIVGAVSDGRTALARTISLQPDLVITDLNMPGMDGAELTRRLKQRPNPPVVLVATGDDTCEARERCLAAGADAFLVKSGSLPPRLLSTIQELFHDDHDQDRAEPLTSP